MIIIYPLAFFGAYFLTGLFIAHYDGKKDDRPLLFSLTGEILYWPVTLFYLLTEKEDQDSGLFY